MDKYKDLTRKQRMKIRVRRAIKNKASLKFIIPIIAVLFALIFFGQNVASPFTVNTFAKTTDSKLTMTFVGDIMLGRNIQEQGEASGYKQFYKNVKSYWKDADFSFANFETAVLRQNRKYTEAEKDVGIYLSTSRTAVKTLISAGVNALACANNHAGDYGRKPIAELCDYLDKYPDLVTYAGIGRNEDEAVSYKLLESNGMKVGFISISDSYLKTSVSRGESAGIFATSYSSYNMIVNRASNETDIVVVYMHFGEETAVTHNSEQEQLAHRLIDAGADIIIGSHPHVLQEVEKYKNGIIFYSLGNFIFDQGMTYNRDSALVQFTLDNDGNGSFEVIPIRINNGVPSETSNIFYRGRIFNQLTKELDKDSYYYDEDGHLVIPAVNVNMNVQNETVEPESHFEHED